MDKHGIGTDATHAEHIETVKQRQYIGVTDNDKLVPGTVIPTERTRNFIYLSYHVIVSLILGLIMSISVRKKTRFGILGASNVWKISYIGLGPMFVQK